MLEHREWLIRQDPFRLREEIVAVAQELADASKRAIIGGLDTGFRGEPFGPMPRLLAIAESVTKPTAICVVSGEPATRTQRRRLNWSARYCLCENATNISRNIDYNNINFSL